MLIGECSDEAVEDEGFCPFLVVTLVRKYPQTEDMRVHQPLVRKAVQTRLKINKYYMIFIYIAISLQHTPFFACF